MRMQGLLLLFLFLFLFVWGFFVVFFAARYLLLCLFDLIVCLQQGSHEHSNPPVEGHGSESCVISRRHFWGGSKRRDVTTAEHFPEPLKPLGVLPPILFPGTVWGSEGFNSLAFAFFAEERDFVSYWCLTPSQPVRSPKGHTRLKTYAPLKIKLDY